MSTASPETLELLERATGLRALGKSWDEVATRLSIPTEELRQLVREHSRAYERFARRAREEVLRDAMDEALAVLRKHLDSDDPAISRSAAATLTKYTLARMRMGFQMDGERPAPRKITVNAENVRAQNVSESSEVQKQNGLAVRKNTAQQCATPAATAATKPAAPAPASNTSAATPAAKTETPRDEQSRRKSRLINSFALGRGTLPGQNDRLDLEIQRLTACSDGNVDDAPPG